MWRNFKAVELYTWKLKKKKKKARHSSSYIKYSSSVFGTSFFKEIDLWLSWPHTCLACLSLFNFNIRGQTLIWVPTMWQFILTSYGLPFLPHLLAVSLMVMELFTIISVSSLLAFLIRLHIPSLLMLDETTLFVFTSKGWVKLMHGIQEQVKENKLVTMFPMLSLVIFQISWNVSFTLGPCMKMTWKRTPSWYKIECSVSKK